MKNLRVIPPFLAALLASLLIVSSAAAQNAHGPTTNELPVRDEIVAARSPYTQMPDISPAGNDGNRWLNCPGAGRGCRLRRGMDITGAATRTADGFWRRSSPSDRSRNWLRLWSGHGALSSIHNQTPVGKPSDPRGFALCSHRRCIGAAHVGSHPFMQRRRFYPPSGPDDDEEGNLRSPSRTKESQKEPSVSTTPVLTAQPPDMEALAAPSPGRTAVP